MTVSAELGKWWTHFWQGDSACGHSLQVRSRAERRQIHDKSIASLTEAGNRLLHKKPDFAESPGAYLIFHTLYAPRLVTIERLETTLQHFC